MELIPSNTKRFGRCAVDPNDVLFASRSSVVLQNGVLVLSQYDGEFDDLVAHFEAIDSDNPDD